MIPYRVKQVLWALTARPLPSSDLKLLSELLSPAEQELFKQFSVNDQNHSIRVVRLLISQGHTHASLQKAAVLHDIGKTRVDRLSVIDRSVAVALKYLLPSRARQWGTLDLKDAKRYQVPAIVEAQHARWGADMVLEIGVDDLTVSLIRRHQDKLPAGLNSEEDSLLVKLQAADNVS